MITEGYGEHLVKYKIICVKLSMIVVLNLCYALRSAGKLLKSAAVPIN